MPSGSCLPNLLELINRGRHHLHDPEALLLQLSQEARQGANRCGMDVVEQQNAFATRLKAVHCQGDDFFRRDTRVPVIRHCVGAEVDESAGRKLAFDYVRAPQSRNAKERRDLFGIAQRGPHVDNPLSISHSTNWAGNLPNRKG